MKKPAFCGIFLLVIMVCGQIPGAAADLEEPLWKPHHAVGDFDDDGSDEVAVDFGGTGAAAVRIKPEVGGAGRWMV